MTTPRVTLRYFPAAGRAQPLRFALADAGVAFEDVRTDAETWMAKKSDPSFAGPHAGLPTLTWGDATVAETLPIASFLAKRLGHYEGLSDEAIAAREAVVSSCYIEVLVRVGEAIYASFTHPGVDPVQAFVFSGGRALGKLDRVEASWQSGADFLFGDRPGLPDFFAFEALGVFRSARPTSAHEALAARLPRLHALEARIRARPNLARAIAERPTCFTVHPAEGALLDVLRSAILA